MYVFRSYYCLHSVETKKVNTRKELILILTYTDVNAEINSNNKGERRYS